jgi:hypothetical protein
VRPGNALSVTTSPTKAIPAMSRVVTVAAWLRVGEERVNLFDPLLDDPREA